MSHEPAQPDPSGAAAAREESSLTQSLRLLWDGLPRPKKGPTPTLNLEQILTEAVALADAQGYDALSLRRLASELGVGTMSLYRYVPNKTVLLNLMLDHVSGRPKDEPVNDRGWRASLEAVGWRSRDLYLGHPWLLQINWARPVLGPNSVTDMELTMSEVVGLPFTDREKTAVVVMLDSYVTGAVRQEILHDKAAAETGLTEDEFWGTQLPFLERAMESGDFPTMAAMADDSFGASWEETFAFGLTCLLDGLEHEVEGRERRTGTT